MISREENLASKQLKLISLLIQQDFRARMGYLGTRVEHTANIGSDAVADVEEGAVVPVRVTGVSLERLLSRLGASSESTQCEENPRAS